MDRIIATRHPDFYSLPPESVKWIEIQFIFLQEVEESIITIIKMKQIKERNLSQTHPIRWPAAGLAKSNFQ